MLLSRCDSAPWLAFTWLRATVVGYGNTKMFDVRLHTSGFTSPQKIFSELMKDEPTTKLLGERKADLSGAEVWRHLWCNW